MALRNNAEAFSTGATPNTTTASPDAFTRAFANAGGTCTVETAAAIGGTKGFRSGGPASSVFQIGWYDAASTATSGALSGRFKGRAAPGSDQRILNLIGTSMSTSRPYFVHRTTGKIELWNAAHTLVSGWTPTDFPTNSTDIVELRLYAALATAPTTPTTSNGTIRGEMWVNGTLVQSVALNGTANAGTTVICGGWIGRVTATPNTTSWDWDDPAFEFGATGLINAVATTPPTLNVDKLADNAWDARSSTAGSGGSLSYSVAHKSGPDVSAGIVEPVDGLWIAATQDVASSSTVTVTVTESPSGMSATEDFVIVPKAAAPISILHQVMIDGVLV